jgi:hypothetical protein
MDKLNSVLKEAVASGISIVIVVLATKMLWSVFVSGAEVGMLKRIFDKKTHSCWPGPCWVR